MMHALHVAGCAAADITAYCNSGVVRGAIVVLAAWEHINIQYLAEDLGVGRELIPAWAGSNYDSVYVLQYNAADLSLTSFHTAAENFQPNLQQPRAPADDREAIDPSGHLLLPARKTDDAAAARPGSYTGAPCVSWQQLPAHNVSPSGTKLRFANKESQLFLPAHASRS
jgi:hypothetical protein